MKLRQGEALVSDPRRMLRAFADHEQVDANGLYKRESDGRIGEYMTKTQRAKCE